MKRSWIISAATVTVAVAVISVLTSNSTDANEGQGTPNRVVQLLPPPGGPYDDARGSVLIFQKTAGEASGFNDYVQLTVKDLPSRNDSTIYALYARRNEGRRVRVKTFNTGGSTAYAAFSNGLDDPAWLTDKVTIEVYEEADDGVGCPQIMYQVL